MNAVLGTLYDHLRKHAVSRISIQELIGSELGSLQEMARGDEEVRVGLNTFRLILESEVSYQARKDEELVTALFPLGLDLDAYAEIADDRDAAREWANQLGHALPVGDDSVDDAAQEAFQALLRYVERLGVWLDTGSAELPKTAPDRLQEAFERLHGDVDRAATVKDATDVIAQAIEVLRVETDGEVDLQIGWLEDSLQDLDEALERVKLDPESGRELAQLWAGF